jgi:hypothetical protein
VQLWSFSQDEKDVTKRGGYWWNFELLTTVMNTYCWYLNCSRPTVEGSDSSKNPLHKEAMISQFRPNSVTALCLFFPQAIQHCSFSTSSGKFHMRLTV